MNIRFKYYPGGKKKALTMSYDDGRDHDRRLVGIFNRHGIRGTFHLNAGTLGQDGYVRPDEVAELYRGHEVSAHSLTHPFLTLLPDASLAEEILEDRRRLESLAGYPVRGMSYPFGAYGDAVLRALPPLGIEYARTVESTGRFAVPDNFLLWRPTCHHKDHLMERLAEFKKPAGWQQMPLLYVWGHSYEFPQDGNWEMIEEFCGKTAGDPDTWYATNIEIADYMNALRNLKFSVDRGYVVNPSAMAVWVEAEGQAVEIRPGTMKLR
jgi:peptidoglycan/xylan/chitin deacetylase (PgdA/CDA1 family)